MAQGGPAGDGQREESAPPGDWSPAADSEAAIVPHAVTGKTPGQIRALILACMMPPKRSGSA
jgi:hypothetical protein